MTSRQRTICHHIYLRDGFTLVEAMLACVILTLAISAIVVPYASGAQNDESCARKAVAAGVAQQLMDEILAKPFRDPDNGQIHIGLDGESGRANFDDIGDYGGYTQAAGTITSDPVAAPMSLSVSEAFVTVNGEGGGEGNLFIRVTITVMRGSETLATLTRLVYDNE